MPIPGSGYGHRCACDLTNDDHGDHPQVSHRRRHHHRDDDRMIEALLAASCCELRHLACLLAAEPRVLFSFCFAGLQLRLQDGRGARQLHHARELQLRRLPTVPRDTGLRLLGERSLCLSCT